MTPITVHTGTMVPLDIANIDTDQIIPKQFLTGVTRQGYGKHLFHDWRYLDQHEQVLNPEFNLNNPLYSGASVLLTRENFGCGSSREHAPWALIDFGITVIIAPSFADIFYGNAINNSMLPICLSSAECDLLFAQVRANAQQTLTVDLAAQQVICGELIMSFEIADHHKQNLLKGLDAIGQTLEYRNDIAAFEQAQPSWI